MLHISKLAVGVRDVAHLRALQAERSQREPPLRHHTRNMPRRRDEVLDGGSLYWVIAGTMVVRQRILDIVTDTWDDGSPCAGLLLDPELVAVEARGVRAFQGWRYLPAADAPADVRRGAESFELPEEMRRELRTLCLI
jgi:hypothetical protein